MSVTETQAGEGERLHRAIRETAEMPRVSPAVLRWFAWYSERYVRRNFHSLRIARCTAPGILPDKPLVIYINHASWWDPLTVLLLTRRMFPGRTFFAPIDAQALARYGLLRRIGMFGVEQGTARGARQFLRTSAAVLERRDSLVITPEGEFRDVRTRPISFRAGLGQLAARSADAVFLPLAVEYTFWEERRPEILVRFGALVEAEAGPPASAEAWSSRLESALLGTQDELARDAMARDPGRFDRIAAGQAGIGGVYDLWRRCAAKLRGDRTFTVAHSAK